MVVGRFGLDGLHRCPRYTYTSCHRCAGNGGGLGYQRGNADRHTQTNAGPNRLFYSAGGYTHCVCHSLCDGLGHRYRFSHRYVDTHETAHSPGACLHFHRNSHTASSGASLARHGNEALEPE